MVLDRPFFAPSFLTVQMTGLCIKLCPKLNSCNGVTKRITDKMHIRAIVDIAQNLAT